MPSKAIEKMLAKKGFRLSSNTEMFPKETKLVLVRQNPTGLFNILVLSTGKFLFVSGYSAINYYPVGGGVLLVRESSGHEARWGLISIKGEVLLFGLRKNGKWGVYSVVKKEFVKPIQYYKVDGEGGIITGEYTLLLTTAVSVSEFR